MSRRKKLLLALLLVLILSQMPFAYRRYQLGQLHAAIQKINSERVPAAPSGGYREYKGVLHVHSFLGGHSKGSFGEIIAGAKSNKLDFVVMTEHPSGDFNTAAMTLKGANGGVLFVNGNEVVTTEGDRFLVLPGDESSNSAAGPSAQVVAAARARAAMSIVAYPQEFKSWATDYDGVEVYNVYTNAREIRPVLMFFDSLWSYRTYPDLLFARFYARPDANLRKWDEAIASRGSRLVGLSGNDSHANIGVNLIDSSGNTWVGLQLDPFERSFKLVRVHVLIPEGAPLDAQTLLEALKSGHCFIGFDLFGDTSGFSFTASNGNETKIQGDEIRLEGALKLTTRVPVTNHTVALFKDGTKIFEDYGRMEYAVTEKGVYRVEVYLPQLPVVSQQPWIISNPIYVR